MTESIPPCRVLGVFGMSMFTRRDDLEKVFSEYGAIDRVEIISNRQVRVFDFSTMLILKFIKNRKSNNNRLENQKVSVSFTLNV